MGFFTTEAEKERRAKLKSLEDRRLRFARQLDQQGFRPENMLFFSNEQGNFVALARHNGQCAVIVSPIFGEETDFTIEFHDKVTFREEEIKIKGEGLGGAFGFGKKAARGFELYLNLNCGETLMQVVAGRTSTLEVKSLKKNPLLTTKRRRGDSNVMWDLNPIDMDHVLNLKMNLVVNYLGE